MSERVMGSISNSTGKSSQTVQPYQPIWMAHWIRGSSNSTAGKYDNSGHGNKELDHVSRDEDSKNELGASRTFKEGSVTETKTECLRMTSKGLGKVTMYSPLIKRETDEIQAIGPISSPNLECGKGGIQFPAAKGDSLREYHSIGEGTSKNPLGWVRTRGSGKDRSSASSVQRYIVPCHDPAKHEFDKGKAMVCPSMGRPSMVSENQFRNSKLRIVEQEHCQKHKESAGLICERKKDSGSDSDTSMNACFRKCNTSLVLNFLPMNDYNLPAIGQDWFQKMQNCSGIALLPNQCIASEKNDSRISLCDNNSLRKLPNCAHDIKAMRLCTTVDSVEAMPGGVPRFSQTTQSLLITKRTDVNMSKENDVFRRLITKMSGKSSTDPHIAQPYSGQASRGLKLQPLSSSSNSEGQGNVRDIGTGTSKVAIKNESSAETDTMDLDFIKDERPNSGANSSRSTKGFNSDMNLSPQFDVASSREVERRLTTTCLPDINLELPALPAAAGSSENAGPTSSQTQSLEMDTLLAHAEHPTPKPKLFLDDSSKPDPTTRWVKRLKWSSSDSSALGTKSSNLPENSSHDEKRKFFSRFLKTSITGKETSLSGRSGDSSKEDGHFTLDSTKKGKELLLSHSWIKRWLRNRSQVSQKKPDVVVVCEPQVSKLSPDDFQKKQFPSIAAMALMGKTMTGLQSCELQKRGSFTVWNTKPF